MLLMLRITIFYCRNSTYLITYIEHPRNAAILCQHKQTCDTLPHMLFYVWILDKTHPPKTRDRAKAPHFSKMGLRVFTDIEIPILLQEKTLLSKHYSSFIRMSKFQLTLKFLSNQGF